MATLLSRALKQQQSLLLNNALSRRRLLSAGAAISEPILQKVLVANRGEIACRVLRTCRKLGIPTVAIYSVADGPNALHARMADEAYLIGSGPTPRESYLLQNEVLEIASQSGAAAIHPGYGFLSENAGFCEAVTDAGMRFVGPPSSAINAMGSKSQSKAIMEAAGVPTTPGYYGDDTQDADYLLGRAVEIGFPLLIKAVMGGGGKGMRLVWNEGEFKAALESCQRESQASFGDSRVLLEKYLVRPRHVEVQVIADTHGNVVHLFERDCSLQRRHQKVIEEAPASDLDPELRRRLGEMGKRAASAVGYVNAGTVEFLLDTTEEDKFYFCEMNTRLQVEHPITELITGIDLVEWQLRIAAGQTLPITNQDDIGATGHAFEARIYAENPARGFLPATGNVWVHNPPAVINTGISSDGVRVDTGLQAGQDISVYYDPMISKLIVHGPTRHAALDRLVMALKNYQIAGVPTNIDFLIKCAQHPTFGKAGQVNTGFLEDYADDVKMFEDQVPGTMAQAIGAFAAMLLLEQRVGVDDSDSVGPWSSRSGSWRMGGESGRARRTLSLEGDGAGSIECVSNRDGSFEMYVAGEATPIYVCGSLDLDGKMEVVVNNTRRIQLETALRTEDGVVRVRMWPQNMKEYVFALDIKNPMDHGALDHVAAIGEGTVKSPMPGTISRVLFSVGDEVCQGQVVVVMEAMKMEHSIVAPCDGTVAQIYFKAGDVVNDSALLFVVDGAEVAAA
ncbi:methylcrotonoyl-CoA carboxylase subunit alpha, mitochondrial [Mayamaea pseudoterrestris]|nr:methylcrotonoyl-CoA carboxylase subunit alpha, mitochondrial [Mayamaea pseudoterrestris]